MSKIDDETNMPPDADQSLGRSTEKRPYSDTESTATPDRENNPVRRNMSNASSRKVAIDAMCAQCMGCTEDYIEPGFRDQIRNCTSRGCQLWRFRPFQTKPATQP